MMHIGCIVFGPRQDTNFPYINETSLPYRPILPGFAINTLFYAGVLWVLFCGPFAMRRMIRRRRSQCPACAYPIGTNEVCTECGAAVTARTSGTVQELSHLW